MKTLLFIIILCTQIQSCEDIAADKDFPLYVKNQSSHSIKVFFNDDDNHLAIYPDTLISSVQDGIIEILNGEKEAVAGGSAPWESVFKVTVPNDTLSLFIFHSDTINRYTWSQIREDYNILKRYDLSLEDLELLDFEVPYPPTLEMEDMRMYPR